MKKSVFFASALFFCSLIFTSCYDAIYQSIRNEVELEEGTVSSFISNIVRYNITVCDEDKQYLFLTNGNVYYKDSTISSHGAWKETSGNGLPSSVSYSYFDNEFSGEYIVQIASTMDSSGKEWLYVLTAEPYMNERKGRNYLKNMYLYYGTATANDDGGIDFDWEKDAALSNIINAYLDSLYDSYYRMDANVLLFCSNAVNKEHRKAFLRVGGYGSYNHSSASDSWTIYELTGGADGSTTPYYDYSKFDEEIETFKSASGGGDENIPQITGRTRSVVYIGQGAGFNGTDYLFLNYLNAQTNEGTEAAGDEPTYVYYGDDSTYLGSFAIADYVAEESTHTAKVLLDKTVETYQSEEYTDYSCKVNAFLAYWLDYYYKTMIYNAGDSQRLIKTEYVTTEDDATIYEIRYASYFVPDNLTRCDMDTDDRICSMAVTNDSILLGTGNNRGSGEGIFRCLLSSEGKPESETADFSTNGDDIMVAPYIIRALLTVDPGKNETECDIYSVMDYIYTENISGTSMSNRGLWSYYANRGNWNRE